MEGASGGSKGTMVNVTTKLVGVENCIGPSLKQLAGYTFALQKFPGKKLARFNDERFHSGRDAEEAVRRLLTVSAGDHESVERKGKDAVTTSQWPALVVVCNMLPELPDSAGAMLRRMLCLKFTKSFADNPDATLDGKLEAELPGILLWAFAGLRRLRDRGRFVQPASGAHLIQDMADLGSPVLRFVREECEVGSDHVAQRDELFARWLSWCEANNQEKPGNKEAFFTHLKSVVKLAEGARIRVGGKRPRTYVGIRLAGAFPELDPPTAQPAQTAQPETFEDIFRSSGPPRSRLSSFYM